MWDLLYAVLCVLIIEILIRLGRKKDDDFWKSKVSPAHRSGGSGYFFCFPTYRFPDSRFPVPGSLPLDRLMGGKFIY